MFCRYSFKCCLKYLICFYLFSTGRCGHGSPCDQLCYELHDGMYECDCAEGFELNKNGYSCQGKFHVKKNTFYMRKSSHSIDQFGQINGKR